MAMTITDARRVIAISLLEFPDGSNRVLVRASRSEERDRNELFAEKNGIRPYKQQCVVSAY